MSSPARTGATTRTNQTACAVLGIGGGALDSNNVFGWVRGKRRSGLVDVDACPDGQKRSKSYEKVFLLSPWYVSRHRVRAGGRASGPKGACVMGPPKLRQEHYHPTLTAALVPAPQAV